MFYYKITWFYQDLKSENLFLKSALSSRCENTGSVTTGHVKSSEMSNGTLKAIPLYIGRGIYFSEAKFINAFLRCASWLYARSEC